MTIGDFISPVARSDRTPGAIDTPSLGLPRLRELPHFGLEILSRCVLPIPSPDTAQGSRRARVGRTYGRRIALVSLGQRPLGRTTSRWIPHAECALVVSDSRTETSFQVLAGRSLDQLAYWPARPSSIPVVRAPAQHLADCLVASPGSLRFPQPVVGFVEPSFKAHPVNRAGCGSPPPAPGPVRRIVWRERSRSPSSTGSDKSGTAPPASEPGDLRATALPG